ncbi:MAG TPA: NUDIX domain-containing protein [Candidatus Saccharimonadales bacterium]|nr:NUDIX domain-containing protein [Candidatus Saccharimonadales bacterium]
MKKHSAGIIVYRIKEGRPEVLLAHMGAPWWAKKDAGAWSVPKGEVQEGEEPLETAKREFTEELGLQVPEGELIELGSVEQSNKTVTAWAVEADLKVDEVKSNTFKAEWPPRSGKTQEFPEIDRADYFGLAEATRKAVTGQAGLFEALANKLNIPFGSEEIPEAPQQGSLF